MCPAPDASGWACSASIVLRLMAFLAIPALARWRAKLAAELGFRVATGGLLDRIVIDFSIPSNTIMIIPRR